MRAAPPIEAVALPRRFSTRHGKSQVFFPGRLHTKYELISWRVVLCALRCVLAVFFLLL